MACDHLFCRSLLWISWTASRSKLCLIDPICSPRVQTHPLATSMVQYQNRLNADFMHVWAQPSKTQRWHWSIGNKSKIKAAFFFYTAKRVKLGWINSYPGSVKKCHKQHYMHEIKSFGELFLICNSLYVWSVYLVSTVCPAACAAFKGCGGEGPKRNVSASKKGQEAVGRTAWSPLTGSLECGGAAPLHGLHIQLQCIFSQLRGFLITTWDIC